MLEIFVVHFWFDVLSLDCIKSWIGKFFSSGLKEQRRLNVSVSTFIAHIWEP